MSRYQIAVVALLALQATIAAIGAQDGRLGLPPIVLAWLPIINVPIGVVLNILPPIGFKK